MDLCIESSVRDLLQGNSSSVGVKWSFFRQNKNGTLSLVDDLSRKERKQTKIHVHTRTVMIYTYDNQQETKKISTGERDYERRRILKKESVHEGKVNIRMTIEG